MDELPPKRRRWFQFRLRTLLVAVLVLSLPLSWFAVKLERARRQRKVVEAIASFGGGVTLGPSAPAWVRAIFGDELFVEVIEVEVSSDKFGDNEAAYLKELTKLKTLILLDTQVTDTGLENLKVMGDLEALWLDGTRVTDIGLKHLKGMGSLEWLSLSSTQITDIGVERLKESGSLQVLSLSGTQVTDIGLEHLKGMSGLQLLFLDGTQITDEGVKKFKEALPDCDIHY